MMDDVLYVQIRQGSTGAYINDVIIGTPPDPQGKLTVDPYHEGKVRQVLQRFREEKLFLKPEKCTFSESTIEYLGFVISSDNIMMDPFKVDAIMSWPIPESLKQTHSFLGFCNFYGQFIQDYALIT